MQVLVALLSVFVISYASVLKPTKKLTSKGSVIDFVISEGVLYAANDRGAVDIFSIETFKKIGNIVLPLIKDATGSMIAPKIYSIDISPDKRRIALVSTGKSGFRELYLHENKRLRKIVNPADKLMIKEARFISNEKIIFGLLSNEFILYEIKNAKKLYRVQMSQAAFSDLALSEDRKNVISSDESGEIHLIDVATGRELRLFSGENVDNVYKVDYKNGVIITAGQDRRCGVYGVGTSYSNESEFLVYGVGLSPSGEIGAYSSNDENEITLFNTLNRKKLHLLRGQATTPTRIYFLNERELFTSSEDENILYWKLP